MRDVTRALADPKRLKQLEIRRILDTPRDEIFDRITRLAAVSLAAPVGLLTFVDANRQWFKSSYGLAEPWFSRRETPLSHSFCQYVVAGKKPLVIEDARDDPLVQENMAITEMNIISYLGAPLIDSDGTALGSLAVADERPRKWSKSDVQTMTDFAAVTMIEVELRTEVSQRTEAEEQLRRSQRLEAVALLAGGVAHDFNNVLLVVQGYASLLEEHVAHSPEALEHLSEIQRAVARAMALTRQLLVFGRKQPLQPARVRVNDVVSELAPLLRHTLGANIELVVELAADAWQVLADPTRLEQIVMNLVINARDASPRGGRIIIRVLNHSGASESSGAYTVLDARNQDGEWVELQVQDFGEGIPPDVLPRIFEPFYTTKLEGKGSGLGLSTVYSIVQQSHGLLLVQTRVGHGSTFRVLLPRLSGQTADQLPSPDVVRATPASFPPRSAAILLVEDDPAVRELLTKILTRAGYSLLAAGDGSEAVRLAAQQDAQMDLTLVDVALPGTNAFAIAEELRARRPELKVLFLSGYSDDADAQRAISEGNIEFVPKPISPADLLARIDALLRPSKPSPPPG